MWTRVTACPLPPHHQLTLAGSNEGLRHSSSGNSDLGQRLRSKPRSQAGLRSRGYGLMTGASCSKLPPSNHSETGDLYTQSFRAASSLGQCGAGHLRPESPWLMERGTAGKTAPASLPLMVKPTVNRLVESRT